MAVSDPSDTPSDLAAIKSTPAPTDGVVRLVTAPEREAAAQSEFADEVMQEALGMLEHAGELLQEHGVSGIAIAFVLKNGDYGRLLPRQTSSMAALIGSIATMQQDLILSTLVDDEE